MKNKIAALLIAFSILPVNLIFANNEVSDFSRNIDMLDAFGILEKTGDEQADAYVTRGEFAGLLYNAMQLNEYDKTKFTDVYEAHLASVAALENYNIVHGHGDEFRPDDIITNTDAVVMIMRALGYSTVAEYAGGYPNGYLTSKLPSPST